MRIHYFTHGTDRTAVEDDAQAERFLLAGWVEVTEREYVEAWQAQTDAWFERAINAASRAGGVKADAAAAGVPGMPSGYKLHVVKG